MTSTSFSGGCQCGGVRYTIAAQNLVGYACHCRECQKQSASAFGVSVPVLENTFDIVGELQSWGRPTDSGSYTDCFFCPQCGTRLYHSGKNRPGLITVKGGSLDDPAAVNFVAHIWTSRRVGWIDLPDNLPQWDEQPETLEEWTALLGWDE